MLCRNKGSDMLFKRNWQLWVWRRCLFGLRLGPCRCPSSTSLLCFGIVTELVLESCLDCIVKWWGCVYVNVCVRVCVCAGWVAGRRESSLAGQKSNGCMWTVAPVFARSGLLLIYLFISCLWADWMKWDCRTSEVPALINNSLRDRQTVSSRSQQRLHKNTTRVEFRIYMNMKGHVMGTWVFGSWNIELIV